MKNSILLLLLLFCLSSSAQSLKGLYLGKPYTTINYVPKVKTTVGGVHGTISGALKNRRISSLLFMNSKDISFYSAKQFIEAVQLKYKIEFKEIPNGANNIRLEANKEGITYGIVSGSTDGVNYCVIFTMAYTKDIVAKRQKKLKNLVDDF